MNLEILADFEQKTNTFFDEWQKEFILASEPHLILLCGRKTGKSYAIAAKCALRLHEGGFEQSSGLLVLSNVHKNAKEILMVVKTFLVRLGYEFMKDRNQIGAKAGLCYASTSEIIMDNGCRLLALPAGRSGDNLRPYSFAAIFYDEADFIQDDVFTSTAACLAVWNGQEILASTPNPSSGKDSVFYRSWYDTNFRRWSIKTAQCDRVPKAWLARQKKSMALPDYQREFECLFTEAVDGIFRRDLLTAATEKDSNRSWKDLWKHETYLGVDFARFGDDDNVIAQAHVDKTSGKVFVAVTVIPGKGTRTTRITEALLYLMKEHVTIRKIVTDDHGVGSGPTDVLMAALGSSRVIGVTNNKRAEGEGFSSRYIKVDLYVNLLKMMEYGIVVFAQDKRIIDSLRGMKYTYGKNNMLSITGKNSHIAEAVVRAVWPLRSMRSGNFEPVIVAMPHKETLLPMGTVEYGWETVQ